MTASIVDTAGDVLRELGYVGLMALMAVEHVFPPIPSELILPLAGVEVGQGSLTLWGAILASTLGSVAGATLLYVLARRGGRPLVLRFRTALRVTDADLDRAERQFVRHSSWVVMGGRMVPGIRSLVSLPPGLLRLPFGRYVLLTVVGSGIWNTVLIVIGQQLGSNWDDVGRVVDPISRVVLVGLLPAMVVALFLRRRSRRRTDESGRPD